MFADGDGGVGVQHGGHIVAPHPAPREDNEAPVVLDRIGQYFLPIRSGQMRVRGEHMLRGRAFKDELGKNGKVTKHKVKIASRKCHKEQDGDMGRTV